MVSCAISAVCLCLLGEYISRHYEQLMLCKLKYAEIVNLTLISCYQHQIIEGASDIEFLNVNYFQNIIFFRL